MNALKRSLSVLAALLIAGPLAGTPAAPAGSASATAATAPAASPAAVSAPLQQQIDALLKHRSRPEPLPLDLPNPFVMNGVREKPPSTIEIVAAVDPAADRPAMPASNAEVLAACAAKLKIGGVIRMKDQIQVVINDSPRKEGDFIAMNWNNSPVQLRIMRLMPDRFLLRFNDAELAMKY